MKTRKSDFTSRSAGITLTEILISILILGVGLVSLATLFPIGLLRLREAQRQTRSAYLAQSSAADVAARGLLNSNSFQTPDMLNLQNGLNLWYGAGNPLGGNPYGSVTYNPLVRDTPAYGADAYDTANGGANPGVTAPSSGGYGLPFAYDPLWRYVTVNPHTGTQGVYLDPVNGTVPEVRFAAGSYVAVTPAATATSLLRPDPSNTVDGLVSAHGLQRLTNFNIPYYKNPVTGALVPIMPSATSIPTTFVSPEDLVWQESSNSNYSMAFPGFGGSVGTPSTVIPDLSISTDSYGNPITTNDWRFSWMITAQQNNSTSTFGSANGAAGFDGNIVIFENRPFSLDTATVNGVSMQQAAGETVVEAVFGPSTNLGPLQQNPPGYGVGADRTVLLRWYSSQPDPVVGVGDWIADVTYERRQTVATLMFFSNNGAGWPNPLNNNEWDNLPAQRCFWYQVQKVTPAQPDPSNLPGGPFRSMTVYVNRKLDAKTLLDGNGNPVVMNAALICPYVVNVIPQSFFPR